MPLYLAKKLVERTLIRGRRFGPIMSLPYTKDWGVKMLAEAERNMFMNAKDRPSQVRQNRGSLKGLRRPHWSTFWLLSYLRSGKPYRACVTSVLATFWDFRWPRVRVLSIG